LPGRAGCTHGVSARGAARASLLGVTTEVVTAGHEGPAQTSEGTSVLPLGGQYELALWMLGDLAVDLLMQRLGVDAEQLAAGHVNLG
jgi:hypothetical protein